MTSYSMTLGCAGHLGALLPLTTVSKNSDSEMTFYSARVLQLIYKDYIFHPHRNPDNQAQEETKAQSG